MPKFFRPQPKRVKGVLGHRASRGAPKPSMCRAHRARHIEGLSLFRTQVKQMYQIGSYLGAKHHGAVLNALGYR